MEARARDGHTPLHIAAIGGDSATVIILLEAGADIEAGVDGGYTPLHLAALNSNVDAVKTLLNVGADIEARREGGYTLYMWPPIWLMPRRLMRFWRLGQTLKPEQKTAPPLHFAAGGGKAGTAEALLRAGADAAAVDVNGDTPFDIAQKNGKLNDTKIYWLLNDARFK